MERSDGRIDRTLPVAGTKQEREIKMHANNSMADRHLWLSIFSRPLYSPVTRVDRVACCFLMLYIFMLANIIYYGVSTTANKGGIVFGPFNFNMDQVALFQLFSSSLNVQTLNLHVLFLRKACHFGYDKHYATSTLSLFDRIVQAVESSCA